MESTKEALFRILGIILRAIGYLIIAAIVALSIYAGFFDTAFVPDDGMYYHESADDISLIKIDGCDMDMYTFFKEDGIVVGGMKTVYACDYTKYKHLIGGYYFTGNTIFSLRKSEIDGEHTKMYATNECTVIIDFIEIQEVIPNNDDIPEGNFQVIFCDDGIYIGGQFFETIQSVPQKISGHIEVLDQLEESKQ